MPEHIDVAAVRGYGKVWSAPRPGGHNEVLDLMTKTLPADTPAPIDGEQGFITSEGRFVTRLEGAQLALIAGQTVKLQWPPELMSDDLW